MTSRKQNDKIEVNRTMIEVNRTMIEVNRTTIEVNRTMIEVNRTMVEVNRIYIFFTLITIRLAFDQFGQSNTVNSIGFDYFDEFDWQSKFDLVRLTSPGLIELGQVF